MHYQSTIQLLKGVRHFLSQGWCREYYAIDRNRCPIINTEEKATAWCIMGAFHEVRNYTKATKEDAMLELAKTVGTTDLILWNDEVVKNQDEVVDALDKTIDRLELEDLAQNPS